MQMTPEEIKARLGSSKNLAELRAKLSKVTNCDVKVKEFYQNQVQLKKFSSLEFDIDVPVRYYCCCMKHYCSLNSLFL